MKAIEFKVMKDICYHLKSVNHLVYTFNQNYWAMIIFRTSYDNNKTNTDKYFKKLFIFARKQFRSISDQNLFKETDYNQSLFVSTPLTWIAISH